MLSNGTRIVGSLDDKYCDLSHFKHKEDREIKERRRIRGRESEWVYSGKLHLLAEKTSSSSSQGCTISLHGCGAFVASAAGPFNK
jgi:hypothetical protein